MKNDQCQVKGCRCEMDLFFYGKRVCQVHFDMWCDGLIDLKKEFGIKEKRCVQRYTQNYTHTHTHIKKKGDSDLKLANFS